MLKNKELKKMLEKYEEELKFKDELIEMFPYFEKNLLYSYNESKKDKKIDLGKSYKDLYLAWEICGFYFNSKDMINYDGEEFENKLLFNLYFNSCSLFDSHEKYGLDKLSKYAFYYDKWNSTFYVEKEKLIVFLEKANEWYLEALKTKKEEDNKTRKEELLKELESLK